MVFRQAGLPISTKTGALGRVLSGMNKEGSQRRTLERHTEVTELADAMQFTAEKRGSQLERAPYRPNFPSLGPRLFASEPFLTVCTCQLWQRGTCFCRKQLQAPAGPKAAANFFALSAPTSDARAKRVFPN
jgi:hypothetical protein